MKESKREQARREAVRRWENTPSPNLRYNGATPAQVGRALLRKGLVDQPVEPEGDDGGVKSRV